MQQYKNIKDQKLTQEDIDGPLQYVDLRRRSQYLSSQNEQPDISFVAAQDLMAIKRQLVQDHTTRLLNRYPALTKQEKSRSPRPQDNTNDQLGAAVSSVKQSLGIGQRLLMEQFTNQNDIDLSIGALQVKVYAACQAREKVPKVTIRDLIPKVTIRDLIRRFNTTEPQARQRSIEVLKEFDTLCQKADSDDKKQALFDTFNSYLSGKNPVRFIDIEQACDKSQQAFDKIEQNSDQSTRANLSKNEQSNKNKNPISYIVAFFKKASKRMSGKSEKSELNDFQHVREKTDTVKESDSRIPGISEDSIQDLEVRLDSSNNRHSSCLNNLHTEIDHRQGEAANRADELRKTSTEPSDYDDTHVKKKPLISPCIV